MSDFNESGTNEVSDEYENGTAQDSKMNLKKKGSKKDKKELDPKANKKKNTIILVVLIVVVVLAIGALIIIQITNTLKTMNMLGNYVPVEEVDYQNLSDTISLSGTVKGISSTNVSSKAQAEVTSVSVMVGDEVKEGDILCVLDSSAIEELIANTEKSISNQEALDQIASNQNQQALKEAKQDQSTQLAACQKIIDQATTEYNNANNQLDADKKTLTELNNMMAELDPESETYEEEKEAVAEQIVACEEAIKADEIQVKTCKAAIDEANTSYSNTKIATDRMVSSAQLQIEMEQYQTTGTETTDALRDLNEQLDDCIVYAPCSGVITAVNVSVGDYNTSGATLFTIEDTSTLVINTTVDERDILRVEEGMEAIVTATATGDKQFTGKVSRVVRVKDNSVNMDGMQVGGYGAEIIIDDSELLVGMTAKVRVIIKSKDEAIAVPYDLVFEDENGDSYVLVAVPLAGGSGQSVAEKRIIETGEQTDYFVEVLSGDIAAGDMIILDTTINEGEEFYSGDYFDAIMGGM